MSKRDLLSAVVLVGLVLFTGGSAQAAPGVLDPSFGAGGKVTTAIGAGSDDAEALALQPDGKIVVAGTSSGAFNNLDFAVARYNPNGSLDPTFGAGGKVTTAIGTANDGVRGVVLQPDGKIVAAGFSVGGGSLDFALVRYNANGFLDTSFGIGD